jgi:L-iditol 2-dehydrogenase
MTHYLNLFMKVAVYYSNSDVRIEERPLPLIADGEILVRMMASGICGTDVMQWYRQQKPPRVLGHEMAGEIVEAGKGVGKLKKGDRVFVSHHVPCFRCRYCDEGNYTACEALHKGNYDPGGFSEYIRVPQPNVKYGTFRLPDEMKFEDAAMIEPLACVLLGQKQLGVEKRHTVLIIGSGISGLLHIQMAKLKGATVVATDINEYRLNKALEFGADHVFRAEEYSEDKLKEVNGGHLADRIVVCAGAKQAVSSAVSSVDRRGKILFFAVPNGDIVIPSMRFWRDEITVAFSYGAAPGDIQEAMDFMSDGRVNASRMITHVLPFSDIQKGFKLVSEAEGSLKVVIVPDNYESGIKN